MTIKTRFWWIRHAVVTENEGKIYGAQDVNCDCSDSVQCRWLAEYLPMNCHYVTSGLQRTVQTAEAVKAQGYVGEYLATYPELNEQSFGAWEGLSYDEVRTKFGNSSEKFWLAPAGKRPDSNAHAQGESFYELTTRVDRALRDMVKNYAGRDIAVFAHGGTIRSAMAIALGLLDHRNPDSLSPIFTLRTDNLGLSRIDHIGHNEGEEYWRIVHFNMLRTS